MARLEGQKTSTGAIVVAAILFSLVAAGLFFAFRPASEAPDTSKNVSASNGVSTTNQGDGSTGDEAVEGGGSSTPLPNATSSEDNAVMDSNSVANGASAGAASGTAQQATPQVQATSIAPLATATPGIAASDSSAAGSTGSVGAATTPSTPSVAATPIATTPTPKATAQAGT